MEKSILSWFFKPVRDYLGKKKYLKEEKKKLRRKEEYACLKELKKIYGELKDFEKFVSQSGKIGIILGARGSGKSALGMRILENIRAKSRKVYAMGFNQKKLPKWVNFVSDLKEIPNNSFLLADEGGIQFSSRNSMSSANKLLTGLLLISRHKNISILFIAQNSSNIEVNTLRQADYLLLRKSSLLQLDFERKKIKEIYKEVEEEFNKFREDKGLTYVYSDVYRGFVSNPLPGFWTDSLSRSFA